MEQLGTVIQRLNVKIIRHFLLQEKQRQFVLVSHEPAYQEASDK